ncbi:HDL004Cp [Eremothecium sinecaudum]|uniref:Dolichyl-diphosphooligosaccharide--protein glycosyltransferase subunit WBP1 n=1 Tax=Eremothecium sinecaudum TaxID=45286 RepID=A0A0X8HSM9_9SACH|nr:HDL004Cp [Eremothecium sinecaudum]AMD20740.1 HDL004Cp [Eremothecium sinecaudum]
MLGHILSCFLCVFSIVSALSVHGLKTLVIYDSKITNLEDYSAFFEGLKKRQFITDVVSVSDADTDHVALYDGETRLYDNLILFPIKGRIINSKISTQSLLQFFSEGGDILAITSPRGLTTPVRVFLNQLGIYPSPKDYQLVDYFQSGTADVITVSTREVKNSYVYSSEAPVNLVYSGSSALLGNSELIVPILPAPRTSFARGKREDDWTIGSQGYMMAAVQNLNNARATWAGSDAFFSNANSPINSQFIEELIKWTFREKGVIKSVGFTHNHIDGSTWEEVPYKIRDPIVYEIGFSEWKGDQWVPYIANDVQFELRMIDPYYRLTLNASRSTKEVQYYSTGEFKLPDHHGVFSFVTDYKRTGISYIYEKDVKAVRHLANDEYPRSYEITNAWVNIGSIFCVIAWYVIFVFLYINIPGNAIKITEKTTEKIAEKN